LIVLALGTAAFMAYRRFVHPAHSVDPADDLPPLVFPMTARTPVVPARSAIAAGASAGAPAGPAPAGHAPPGAATQDAVPTGAGTKAAPRAGGRGGTPGTRGEARTPRRNGRARVEPGPDGADATLQLLPGRLEVVDGEAGAEEIRFVRPAGGDPVVTLGRGPGGGPGSVRLLNPTVSRSHARLRFEDGEWHIVNLSSTNPALLNGEALPVGEGERALRDGDRLELGEVVLRYRQR
ncbi:MAG TPA: FHA domain-containing protein, partial [Longimicrobiales bacterium]|nr:FHA domain-containing protein [Longimicrobiales bacterium]